jgi:hypothetical protein
MSEPRWLSGDPVAIDDEEVEEPDQFDRADAAYDDLVEGD